MSVAIPARGKFMNQRIRLLACTLIQATAMTSGLGAAERGTPAEAKALLQKAVAHYRTVGRKQALADFTDKKPPFIDRDLYVACVGPRGIVTANAGFPMYVGASAHAFKDANGRPVGTTIWNIGMSKGEGEIQHPMLNPLFSKIEQKTSYFSRVGEGVCAVGAYNAR
jgi:hypothetical protein